MRFLRRIAYWLRFARHDAELMDELALHREMMERDLIARGMSPDTARAQARRAMGNETLMREASRGIWLWPSLEGFWQDAAYTLRDLRRSPTFTVGVVLTLGLGIGANAAMFSLVDRLLFRAPARMIDPESVHQVFMYRTSRGKESGTGGQVARVADIRRFATVFSQTAGVREKELPVGSGAGTRLRNVAIVSASFFDFFDAPPALGRYYTPDDDSPQTHAPVAVVSHGFWERELAKRADVLGSTLRIDAVEYTIIGVAPDGFVGLWPYRPPIAFVPVAAYGASVGSPDWATTYSSSWGLGLIARRKPGVSVAAASADLTTALRRSYIAEGRAKDLPMLRPRAVAAPILIERGPESSSVTRAARWLSGVSVIVLLIACANVANLLLARTIRRRREIAVRLALGVSRGRLVGQLLTEGIVLAVLGGIAGVLIAIWGGNVLRATFLPGTEPTTLIGDARTLLFSGAVALGVGVLTGLAPLAQLRSHDVVGDLKAGAREGTQHRTSLRTGLLLVQSALSVVLLVGAGLFVRSLRNVRDIPLGFQPDSVLLVSLEMRDAGLDSAAMVALRLRLLAAAEAMPGVAYATLQESVPFHGMSSWPIAVAGIDSARTLGEFDFNTVSAGYFATMGTRILRGRAIETGDRDGGRRVAVIGQSMANVLWPGQEPIGQCFRVGIPAEAAPCTYVVGVAEDIHSQSLEAEPKLFFYYMPAAQWRPHDGGLFVRPKGDARASIEPLRLRLQRQMPGTAFITVQPLADFVDARMRSWIVGARVFTAFGLLALLLAAVGLYSVIAYNVTQRTRELGVRLALGAARGGIVRLVVLESLRITLMGVVAGGIVALGAGGAIAPMLFAQSPRDPTVFAIVGLVLAAAAIAASWIPALRAAHVDPLIALRSD